MTFVSVEKIENFGKTLIPYQDLDHTQKARVICVSDTHNRHRDLAIQEGDIFIHAGDITQRGTLPELQEFNAWLASLPHKHKIVIGGNHDEILLSPSLNKNDILSNCTYLEYSSTMVYGWKIFGYPSSIKMFSNHNTSYLSGLLYSFLDYLKPYQAFQVHMGTEQHLDTLSSIPTDCDILISHGPPYGAGDLTNRGRMNGDKELRSLIDTEIKPRFHIFGHIHEAHSVSGNGCTTFINAASPKYPWAKGELNPPIVFDIDIKENGVSKL